MVTGHLNVETYSSISDVMTEIDSKHEHEQMNTGGFEPSKPNFAFLDFFFMPGFHSLCVVEQIQ